MTCIHKKQGFLFSNSSEKSNYKKRTIELISQSTGTEYFFFRLQIASVSNYYCRKDGKSMCFARYKRRAFQGCNRKK